MDIPVQLIFRGEVLDGFLPDDVRRSLGDQLQLDAPRLAHLFSGQRVVLKRSIDAESARRRVAQFAVLGARLHIEAVADAPPATRLRAASTQPPTMLMPARPLAPVLRLVPGPEAAADTADADSSITCPKCGEQQPQQVFCRSCTTNMPMGIAAQLEEQAKAKAEKDAVLQARREALLARSGKRPPRASRGTPVRSGDAPFWGLGLDGRMARRPYAAAGAGVSVLLSLLTMFVLQRPGTARFVLAGFVLLALLLLSLRWTVLRCHDVDRSGWWSLLLLLPYLGPLAGIVVSLVPGQEQDNRFGPPPEPGSWLPVLLTSAVLAVTLSVGAGSALRGYERDRVVPPADAAEPAGAEEPEDAASAAGG